MRRIINVFNALYLKDSIINRVFSVCRFLRKAVQPRAVSLSANEFGVQVKLVSEASSTNVSGAKRRSALNFMRMVFDHLIIPRVSTAQDVLQWNEALRELAVVKSNSDPKELSERQRRRIDEFIVNWWNVTCHKFDGVDVFKMMSEVKAGSEDALTWMKAFPAEMLIKVSQLRLVLLRGEIGYLVEHGYGEYVIENFENIRIEGNDALLKDAYVEYAEKVSCEMMEKYLGDNPKKYMFFTFHPLGLKVLAEMQFSGVIAGLEKEFIAIGKNFPEKFKVSPEAEKEYLLLLNMQLETDFKIPGQEPDEDDNL
ncbi:MAG: hypothetical protein VZR95_01050 [Alphaproteobacteria bacterium]